MKTIRFKQQRIPAILDGSMTAFRRPINGDIAANFDWDVNDKDYIYYEDAYGDSHHAKELAKYQVGDLVEIMTNKKTGVIIKITDVRVERLRDMTEESAEKEGMTVKLAVELLAGKNYLPWSIIVGGMKMLWNEIYADKGYGWETDPWVFVHGFKLASKED